MSAAEHSADRPVLRTARCRGLDVTVNPLRVEEVVDLVRDAARRGRRLWLGNLNLHGAYMHLHDDRFAEYCRRTDVLLVDGWPILATSSTRRRRLPAEYRVGSTDWLDALLRGEDRLSIVAVGSDPDTARRAASYVSSISQCRWEAVDGYDLMHRP